MATARKIELFVKASDDGRNIGNCPFCQRCFMHLWMKNTPFTVTFVDMKRAPEVLKEVAPGSQPPFLLYEGEVRTDVNKIEEFIEETLCPPHYPRLSPRYDKSNMAGSDIFHKFSSYIKNQNPAMEEHNEKALLRTMFMLDKFLGTPLEHELKADPNLKVSKRLYLDGDELTLADCNLLPKLHIVQVVCKEYRKFGIPKELTALSRYLSNAYKRKEFANTCPENNEIINAYKSVAKYYKI
ncbi:chloride intracellular channel protein 4-like [Protopterus annectens]|uniref:chloride intracellular channel protein 4-like n=1 Tax=Protopterus annectens TaxID=7888 RepID=UPI001CFB1F8F|nr:chloride intracellular channel protein 4-like [Protopterus annectens]